MNMFMLVRISISEGKGFHMCNDQVFEWLPFFCSILNLTGGILANL